MAYGRQGTSSRKCEGVPRRSCRTRFRAFVADLEKRRYAVTARPRTRAGAEPSEPEAAPDSASEQPANDGRPIEKGVPRRRGRHVPAAVRRAVFERDGGQCAYVDASGQRCREMRALELHHLTAFARGGEHSERNVALRCRAHNALAAEADFGRDFIVESRDASAHEPFAAQASAASHE